MLYWSSSYCIKTIMIIVYKYHMKHNFFAVLTLFIRSVAVLTVKLLFCS